MPTIQEEKAAKSRARNRKADSRSSKGGQKRVEVKAEVDPASLMVTEPEAVETVAAVEIAPVETVAAVEVAPVAAMEPAVTLQEPEPAALTGEVLPPEVVRPASHVDGFQAMAQAYGEYTKQSWLNGRFLMERLIAVRSFDEAIEIQGEFARQAYSNFLTHSERICLLYGEWALGFFRSPLATEWPRR